jgi:hypothetical protein
MTTTFNELVERVLGQIQSYGSQQETATWINQSGGIASTTATSFIVNETAQMGRGIIEVGDELMYVDRTDNLTKQVYLAPWGRGFRGTTASTAANESKVVIAPQYPRFMVKQAINDTIQAVYPELFGVGTHTFSFNSAVTTYSLPAAADYVLNVKWQTIGSTKEWLNVKRYDTDKTANTSNFANGKSINIFDTIDPGRTVQVIYAKAPSVLTSGSDIYETVTGLPSSTLDVITYGAIARLIVGLDAARVPAQSVEADMMDQSKPLGSATSTARFYLGLYQQRLQQEAAGLRDLYPPRLHYTR